MRLWEKSAPSLDCSCIQVRHWCASCQKKALQLCTPFFVRFYCRCGLHSRERMGFIAFQIKAARQVTCVCVCAHSVCTCWDCSTSSVPLLASEMNVFMCCLRRGVWEFCIFWKRKVIHYIADFSQKIT